MKDFELILELHHLKVEVLLLELGLLRLQALRADFFERLAKAIAERR